MRTQDLEALCKVYSQSVFRDLKWLLLSSRLQASCCPTSWSLRSKMRLPPCCERGPAPGKTGRKELAVLVQGHLFFLLPLYHCDIEYILDVNVSEV